MKRSHQSQLPTIGSLYLHNRELAENYTFALGVETYLSALFIPDVSHKKEKAVDDPEYLLSLYVLTDAFEIPDGHLIDLSEIILDRVSKDSMRHYPMTPAVEGIHELSFLISLGGNLVNIITAEVEIVRAACVPVAASVVPSY